MATTYRTCPISGMQFEDQAEKLMRWNAVAGVLWLLVGGVTALLVILTLARGSGEGAVSAYQYAFIFFQLPYGLIAVSIMTAILAAPPAAPT